jgi:hypothetical protein
MEMAHAGEAEYLHEYLSSELAPSRWYSQRAIITLGQAGHIEKAIALTQGIPSDSVANSTHRSAILENFAATQAQHGDLEAAETTLRLVPKDQRYQSQLSAAWFLVASAAERMRRGQHEIVQRELDDVAVGLLKDRTDPSAKADAWLAVGKGYLELGDRTQARRDRRGPTSRTARETRPLELIKNIDELYLALQLQDEALQSVRSLKEPFAQVQGFIHLALVSSDDGNKDWARVVLAEAEGMASHDAR